MGLLEFIVLLILATIVGIVMLTLAVVIVLMILSAAWAVKDVFFGNSV